MKARLILKSDLETAAKNLYAASDAAKKNPTFSSDRKLEIVTCSLDAAASKLLAGL